MIHDIFIFIEAIGFLYIAFLAGKFFVRRIPGAKEVRIFSMPVYETLVGIGVLGLVGLACAIFGIFSGWVLRGVALTAVIMSYRTVVIHMRLCARAIWQPRLLFYRLRRMWEHDFYFKLLLFLWLGFNVFLVFVPITGNDTLQYHQPIIQDVIDTGRIDYRGTTHSIYGVVVFVELLYAFPSVLFGNTVAPFIFQVLQYFALIMLLALLYGFAQKRVSNSFLRFGLLFFVLAIFDLQREVMHGGYIDIFVIVFGLASMLLLVDRLDDRRGRVLPICVLSAFLFGIAIGMKYTALFFAPSVGVLLIALLVREKMSFKRGALFLSVYGAVSFAVSGYWYIKNFIFFANPIYPMFSLAVTKEDVGVFVVSKSLLHMLLFPFLKFGIVSETDSSSKIIIAGYFALMYALALFFVVFKRRMLGAVHYALFFFIHIYMWSLFFNSHQTRFLLPAIIIVPLLLVLYGDLLYRLMERARPPLYGVLLYMSRALFLFLFVLLFWGNVHYFYVKFLYKAGWYTEQEYIVKIGGQ